MYNCTYIYFVKLFDSIYIFMVNDGILFIDLFIYIYLYLTHKYTLQLQIITSLILTSRPSSHIYPLEYLK